MDSANNDRATLYINRHFRRRRRRRRVCDRQLRKRKRKKESEKGGGGGVIEKVLAVCELADDRLISFGGEGAG